MNEDGCWAESIGDCEGPITAEHLASKSLFKRPVRIQGGANAGQTANILCRKHNNELGRTADAAALQFYRHLKASHRPLELPGSRILRPPVDRRVSGVNFGRWICKTHCNFMVAHGMTPDPAYVRYAFLRPSRKSVYFYFDGGVGEPLRVADGRDPVVGWQQFLSDNQPDFDSALISLAGFRTMLSTVPLKRNGSEMVDRLRAVEYPTPLGLFRIVLDWDSEPALALTEAE